MAAGDRDSDRRELAALQRQVASLQSWIIFMLVGAGSVAFALGLLLPFVILINPTRPDGQVSITLLFTIVAAFGEGFGPTRGTAPFLGVITACYAVLIATTAVVLTGLVDGSPRLVKAASRLGTALLVACAVMAVVLWSDASYEGGAVRTLSPAVLAVAVGAVATIVAARFCSRPAMERGAR